MRNKIWGFTVLGFMMMIFPLAALPVQADSVDEQIKALKDEVARLENSQAQIKAEQIEIKREATAATAQIPNFSYRPGRLLIESADKTWAFRTSLEANFRLEFESGLSLSPAGIFFQRKQS